METRAWATATPYTRCLMGAIGLSTLTLIALLVATFAAAPSWVFGAIALVGLGAIGYTAIRADGCR
ncbi:MAG: hypothetical protein ACOY93_11445 [Bacillota bacterium]